MNPDSEANAPDPADYDSACEHEPAYQACLDAVATGLGLGPDDIVLDMATSTGNFALAAAPVVKCVHARDPEPSWLAHAQGKADRVGIQNVTFGVGSLADPRVDGPVDIVIAAFILDPILEEEGPDGFDAAVRALTATGARRIILPDHYAKDERAAEWVPLPHVEAALERSGYAVTGVEWFGDSIAIVVADRGPRHSP